MMKKVLLAVFSVLLLMPTAVISAQAIANQKPYSTVQVSFFPPLSTNGRYAGQYTNGFSFNLLAGVSENERAFTFAGLTNVIYNNAAGFQFAGLSNHVGGKGYGFQFGGLANIVVGNFNGFQFGGLFNSARDFEGFQLGGLANIIRNDFDGFQFGGLANIVGGDFKGFQLGGLANIIRGDDFEGLQFGGLFNSTRDFEGLQFGGLANITGDIEGFQFAGLFNVAKYVYGVQFAGLVNIADHSDYPIGLVNIIKKGEMGIGVGYNEIGTVSLTLRSGGRVLYGIIGLGYNHRVAESRDAMTIVGGYGAHIDILPWLRINNEFTTESIDILMTENSTFRAGYALLPAFRFGNFEIFAGPNINYMQSDAPNLHDIFPKTSFWRNERGNRLQQAYIGWQAGVQFVF